MNRLLVCHVLLAAFCLIGARPTDEECANVIKPLNLTSLSQVVGSGNMRLAYIESDVFKAMLKVTQKSEINMTETDGVVVMEEELKINGTCYHVKVNMNLKGGRSFMKTENFTAQYDLLPSCDDCWLIAGNFSGKAIKKMLEFMKLDIEAEDEISGRAVYFYSKDELREDQKEEVKKVAECLNIEGEPSFQYDPDQALCDPDKVVELPL